MDVYNKDRKSERREYIDITFQEGAIGDVGVNGAHVEDVIDVLVERLRDLNTGELACRETSLAITHLEEAGLWCLKRRMNRLAQGVEGTMSPHK
jgi:hypothetical protein